ncbi:MAG: type II secretion system protein GspL [Congregibacter sp.]|nr:type II secretion system protein GspL [Congregibacter sp.]
MNLENINVVRWQQGQGFLLRPGAVPERLADDGVRLPENTFLVLPSDVVRNITVPVAAEEVKHLRRALPFMLEESLLEDVADLHFAHTPLDEGNHAVSVVARAKVAQWMDELPESLREVPWISEALCLPWTEGQWTLLFESDSVLVRWSEAEGARVEATLLPALLDSLHAEQVVLVAYGQDEAAAMAAIPGRLRQQTQWRQGGLSEALLLTDPMPAGPDLRQGEFAPQLPLMRWWGVWQRVAVALGVALILKTGVSVADYQSLKGQNLQLRQAVQDSYRRVNPRGAVVDVEKQLDRQLTELGAGSQQRVFTPVLVRLLSAADAVPDITLTSVNFSGARDIRVNLLAPDFQSVEQVRDQLGQRGLDAELESSNARRDGVVARLRVEI